MENKRNIENVINIACRLTNLVEGFNDNNKSQLLSTQFKILYQIYKQPHINATVLSSKLDMAKSNLALSCKKFILNNLIVSTKDSFDKRSVFYDLTEDGTKYVEDMLNKFEQNFEKDLGLKASNKELLMAISKLNAMICNWEWL